MTRCAFPVTRMVYWRTLDVVVTGCNNVDGGPGDIEVDDEAEEKARP